MTKRLTSAVIATALLMSGAVVGVEHAGGSGSTQPAVLEEPTVIELEWHTGGRDSYIYIYPLWDSAGKRSGQVTTKRLALFDVDGNEVGREYIDCMATSHTGWVCTLVSVLKDGPYTDKGTVVATGVSKHRPGKPNISTMAVTGGTGAYSNVSGQVIQEGVDGHITYTLYLMPS
jgi:hypothetical protein